MPARRIAADLAKYPVVLKENHHLRTAVKGYEWGYAYQRTALAHKDSALAATGRQLVDERMLRTNAAGEAAVWKGKAKRRWWVIAAEAVVIVLLGAAATR